jgi:hypothetical protein
MARGVQHPIGQYPPVGRDDARVSLFEQRLELPARFSGLDLRRLMDWKAVFGGENFDGRRRGDLFAPDRPVGLREDGDDFMPGFDKFA